MNGWLSGGEWRLEHNHAVRGHEAWRRYDTPPGLKAQGGAWEAAELRGWEVARGNGTMTVTLTWRATGRAAGPVHRFVHLVPREGAPVPVAQNDGVLGGDHPATEWAPGEWVTERLSLTLPPEGFDGRLLVGLYDPASGTRHPVSPDAGDQTFELRP
jgi:hypothetical protein